MIINGHNILFMENQRFYVEDLCKYDYTLTNTTPYQIIINGYTISDTAWIRLIPKVAQFLQKKYPKELSDILSFSASWSSKIKIFTTEKRINFKLAFDDVYINCNHSAIHSCWLIKELLEFYGIDLNNVSMIIHRSPSSEPEEVRKVLISMAKQNLKTMLINQFNKTEEISNKIINNIDTMSDLLKNISGAFDNWLLFENTSQFTSYKKEVINNMKNLVISDKTKEKIMRYLEYLTYYYKNS